MQVLIELESIILTTPFYLVSHYLFPQISHVSNRIYITILFIYLITDQRLNSMVECSINHQKLTIVTIREQGSISS